MPVRPNPSPPGIEPALERTLRLVLELHDDAAGAGHRRRLAQAAVMWWAWRSGHVPLLESASGFFVVVGRTDGAPPLAVAPAAGHDPSCVDWLAAQAAAGNAALLVRVGRDRRRLPDPPAPILLLDCRI